MLSLLIFFSGLLCLLLLVVYFLTSYPSLVGLFEKSTPFECGFDPLNMMRAPFSARFFILAVLFIIFDVEVALLFPLLSLLSINFTPAVGWVLVLFLGVLLAGLFHEWAEGALDWISA
uniref:NADH dehydrogenase subunit 3 n=1 Tax=Melampus sincaporensis TaxID=1628046 RepID=UPI0030033477|nr:NADH dehydrogenase subunit 3 [Melampus sincaporensis]